jgi:hypothetical protein
MQGAVLQATIQSTHAAAQPSKTWHRRHKLKRSEPARDTQQPSRDHSLGAAARRGQVEVDDRWPQPVKQSDRPSDRAGVQSFMMYKVKRIYHDIVGTRQIDQWLGRRARRQHQTDPITSLVGVEQQSL